MIDEVVEKYLKLYPEDRQKLTLLLDQIAKGDDLSDRTNYTGHITGGAVVFAPNKKKVLLVDHPTLEYWLQPGGHWDKPEAGPWETSERELVEETGVKIEKRLYLNNDHRIPILIDSHVIPTRPPKNEPQHFHHDFKYAFLAQSEELSMHDKVIEVAEWVEIDDPRVNEVLKDTVNRLAPLLNS